MTAANCSFKAECRCRSALRSYGGGSRLTQVLVPSVTHTRNPQRFKATRILLGLGFVSSAIAWLLIAPPVITFSSTAKHSGHFGLVYFHVLGGTIMLFLGLANLYIGTTRRHFNFHKLLGRIYLIGGGLGASAAILITSSAAHKPAGVRITNTTISLLTLATAWLLAAAIAYRAVRNKRYDSHREWVIRSYVLACSFVFCRLAGRVPAGEDLGDGRAFIWLSWVGPLIVCEAALLWQRGSDSSLKRTAEGWHSVS